MKRVVALTIGAVVCFFAGNVYNDLQHMFTNLNTAGIREWQEARLSFLTELAGQACVTEAQMRDAAEARGWAASLLDTSRGDYTSQLDGAARILIVDVTPSLPFSKQDGEWFRFDDAGCYRP